MNLMKHNKGIDVQRKYLKEILKKNVMISVADKMGSILFANRLFCDYSGYAEKELLGENYLFLCSGEQSKGLLDEILSTIAKKETWRGEIYNRKKDGGHFWTDTIIVPFLDENGEVENHILIGIDVSKRKSRERKKDFELFLLNQVHSAVILTNYEGKIIYWNDFAEVLYQWKREEVLGKDLVELFKPKKVIESFLAEKLLSSKDFVVEGEYSFKRKDGEIASVFVKSKAVVYDKDKQEGLLAVGYEITGFKEVESLLLESNSIINRSPVVTMLWDEGEDWVLLYISENVENLLGYTAKELMATGFSYKGLIHPDDLDWAIKDSNSFVKASKEGNRSLEYRMIAKNGQVKWVRDYLSVRVNKENERGDYQSVLMDITDLKEAEFALNQSRNELLEAQNIAKIGSYTYYFDTQIMKTSPVVNSIFGIDIKAPQTIDFYRRFMDPEDVEASINRIEYCINTGELYDWTFRIVVNDGEKVRWVHNLGKVIFNEGKPVCIRGTIQDVTKEKLSEIEILDKQEKLEKSEKKFHDLFEKSTRAHFIFSKGKINDCNSASLKMLGYENKADLIGAHPVDFSPRFQPDGQLSEEKSELMIATAIKKGSYVFEWMHKKKNGVVFPAEVALKVILNDSNEKIIHAVVIDISKQRKAEEDVLIKQEEIRKSEKKFHDLFEKSGDANFIVNNEVVVDCNQAALIMLGYENKEEIIGKHPEIFTSIHQANEKTIFDQVKEVNKIAIEKGAHSFEWLVSRRNGEVFPIEVSLTPFLSSTDDWNIHAVCRDITMRKQAELALKDSLEEVRELKLKLEQENVYLREEIAHTFNFEEMVYSSEEFSDVLTELEQVAPTDASVLVLGETGTGKEPIARAIHNISKRKHKSLIKINCAAIPSELIESELFGHVKGAFTGAIKDRIGKFELADEGTLFLDEVGEIPLELQSKLLRALQEGEIEPVGSNEIRKVNVRIIAATNRDLKEEAKKKRFREDLYFRLNVFPINIPPLRERVDDIPVLVEYFISKFCAKYHKEVKFVSNLTMRQMQLYPWPGNIRELENAVERAVILSKNKKLVFSQFDSSDKEGGVIDSGSSLLDDVQRNHILKVLEQCGWVIDGDKGASVVLGVKPSTLRDKMKKLGIKRLA